MGEYTWTISTRARALSLSLSLQLMLLISFIKELVTRCFMGEYKTPYYSDNKALQHDAAVLVQVARKGLRPSIRFVRRGDLDRVRLAVLICHFVWTDLKYLLACRL